MAVDLSSGHTAAGMAQRFDWSFFFSPTLVSVFDGMYIARHASNIDLATLLTSP